MWCVQEIAVAQQVRLICGEVTITWDELMSAIKFLRRLYASVMDTMVVLRIFQERLDLLLVLRAVIQSTRSLYNDIPQTWSSLATLIAYTRNKGATDPRDKVFALAGLFKRMGIQLPPLDYSKSVQHVYQQMTQTAIRQFQTLDILYQVTGLENQFDLPSWVPDLSDVIPPRLLMHETFRATASSPTFYRFSDENSSLTLWGRIIGQIDRCGDPLVFNAQPNDEDAVLLVFKQWSTIAQSTSSYPYLESMLQIFARTLSTNWVSTGAYRPSAFLTIFPTWHALMISAHSGRELLNNTIENMIHDIRKIPIAANEKREFAFQMVAATLEMGVFSKVSKKTRARILHHWLAINMRRKVFFTMTNGYMGLSASSVRETDSVALLAGLNVPFVVKKLGTEYRLVALAYVHGVMEGELWDHSTKLDEFVFI